MFKPITAYLPQRPPVLMVDSLTSCDEHHAKSIFNITADNIFVEKGYLTEPGIIENIAQTCAARLGFLSGDQPVKIGVIGSIDNLEIIDFPQVGDLLETTVTVKVEMLNVVLIAGSVVCKGKEVANGSMKVFLTD
ncbi:MAG: hypothetical protein LBH82_02530, partial [Bacteroidales bacterium]|nr:hypothetical protein [Bacteroidales bacterium]